MSTGEAMPIIFLDRIISVSSLPSFQFTPTEIACPRVRKKSILFYSYVLAIFEISQIFLVNFQNFLKKKTMKNFVFELWPGPWQVQKG